MNVLQNHPIVEVRETASLGAGWVTSGTVKFLITSAGHGAASLTFEFERASSEKDAIRQAAEQLAQVAGAFQQMALRFLEPSNPR